MEWCYPDGIELEDIEFRAMASGFHNVDSDFMLVEINFSLLMLNTR